MSALDTPVRSTAIVTSKIDICIGLLAPITRAGSTNSAAREHITEHFCLFVCWLQSTQVFILIFVFASIWKVGEF
jgi:hypothetical protein